MKNMSHLRALVTAAMFFGSHFSYSQTFEYQKGFYIDMNGDSVHGYIYDDEKKRMSEKVVFRINPKSDSKDVSANQVKEVRFEQNHLVTYLDSVDNRHCFLFELEHGKINLFTFYRNEEDTYIVEKNGERTTLYQYGIDIKTGEKVKSSRYKGLLKILTEDCSINSDKIEKLTFELYKIRELILDYNRCVDPKISSVSRKIQIKLGVNLGVNYNQSEIYFTTIFKDVKQESDFGLVFGGFIEAKLHKRISGAILLNYTEYRSFLSNFKDPNSVIVRDVDFRFTYLDLPLQLKYNILDSKVDLFVFGGYGIGYLLSKKIDSHSDYTYASGDVPFDLDKFKFGWKGGIGLSFKKLSTQAGYYKSRGSDGPSNVISYRGFECLLSYSF